MAISSFDKFILVVYLPILNKVYYLVSSVVTQAGCLDSLPFLLIPWHYFGIERHRLSLPKVKTCPKGVTDKYADL